MDGDSKAWCILVLAGIMEMVWAIAMDYSEGFTNMLFGINFFTYRHFSYPPIYLSPD